MARHNKFLPRRAAGQNRVLAMFRHANFTRHRLIQFDHSNLLEAAVRR